MAPSDRLFGKFALMVGFVAFSMPLLFHDTKHLWREPPPPAAPTTPSYPTYPPYQEEDSASSDFRKAVNDGDATRLAELVKEHGAELVNKEHWHGNTPIFEAARSGKLDVVKWLLEHGAPADEANEWGDSPINEAAAMGHFDVVRHLADLGANISRTSGSGHNGLLLSAVRHRSVDALDQLARRGVDLAERHWNGNTALHEAARTGELPLVKWLVAHGADVNATNDTGEGAVSEAATMGHFDAVWELLGAGAAVGASGSSQAASLAMAAVRHDKLELLERLHGAGAAEPPSLQARAAELPATAVHRTRARLLAARPRAPTRAPREPPPQPQLLREPCALSLRLPSAGYLPISACASPSPACIPISACASPSLGVPPGAGVDVGALTQHGATPLVEAVRAGHKHTVDWLLKHGADPTGPHTEHGAAETPIAAAAYAGHFELMWQVRKAATLPRDGPTADATPTATAVVSRAAARAARRADRG